jgi:hypothetical protein
MVVVLNHLQREHYLEEADEFSGSQLGMVTVQVVVEELPQLTCFWSSVQQHVPAFVAPL